MAIDTKPFVKLAEARRGSTHFEGCEHYHASCAVLYLAGALDAAQKRLDEYKAEIERLRAVIRKAEWITDDDDGEPFCGNCGANKSRGHDEECPFNGWEGER